MTSYIIGLLRGGKFVLCYYAILQPALPLKSELRSGETLHFAGNTVAAIGLFLSSPRFSL